MYLSVDHTLKQRERFWGGGERKGGGGKYTEGKEEEEQGQNRAHTKTQPPAVRPMLLKRVGWS